MDIPLAIPRSRLARAYLAILLPMEDSLLLRSRERPDAGRTAGPSLDMQSHLRIPSVWWDSSQDRHALQLAFGVLVSDRTTPRPWVPARLQAIRQPRIPNEGRVAPCAGARGSRRQPEASSYVSGGDPALT